MNFKKIFLTLKKTADENVVSSVLIFSLFIFFIIGSITIKVSIITAAIAIWTFYQTKKKDVESSLFKEKAEAYKLAFQFVMGMFSPTMQKEISDSEEKKNKELTEKIINVRNTLITWGSIEVIRAFQNLLSPQKNDLDKFMAVHNFLASMRRDLGYRDIYPHNLYLCEIFVKPEDKEKIHELMKEHK